MRTFLDSGVLLTAWKGKERLLAIEIMEDNRREFYSSEMVRLELLPKAVYHKQTAEVEFYQLHFSSVRAEEPLTSELGREAFALAKQYGLAAIDSLHIAAAVRQNVDEFITSEIAGKPLFRVKEVKVRSLEECRSRR